MNEAAMNAVLLAILVAAAAALVLFLIPALLEVRRTARSATLTLDTIRGEIRPVTQAVQGALQEHREIARRANRDLQRLEELLDQARHALDVVGKMFKVTRMVSSVSGVASVARAGQKGAEAFLHRLRKTPRR